MLQETKRSPIAEALSESDCQRCVDKVVGRKNDKESKRWLADDRKGKRRAS